MKQVIAIIASVFALTAFAADAQPAKTPVAATPAPAPVASTPAPVATTASPAPHKSDKKAEVKPVKSEPAKDTKAEAVKK